MSVEVQKACFGFYIGSPVCGMCAAHKRCKALLITDGFDIVGSLVEHLEAELKDAQYRDTDKISELTDQLITLPDDLTEEEKELLSLFQTSEGQLNINSI